MKTPLRLDIAGSYTDLPGYREKGGRHINLPLDYYIHVQTGNNENAFVNQMNIHVSEILKVSIQPLTAVCDLEHGSGLGASSATVVGIVKYYSEKYNLSLSPYEIALSACKAIGWEGGIVGRQDEYSAAFACPLYLLYLRYYKNTLKRPVVRALSADATVVDTTVVKPFELPTEFRQNIAKWKLLYIPRTIPCQEMLDYEMNANFNIEPIVQHTVLMYNAVVNADWSNFYQAYKAHWLFVEGQNPSKINADIREIRRRYEGIYIRPCGAGAGGYLLIHGDVQGENIIDLKLKEN